MHGLNTKKPDQEVKQKVPVKCKLTVTRNLNDSTPSSKLEYFEYRVVQVLSRDKVRSINFPNTCACKSCWFTFGDRNFRFAT